MLRNLTGGRARLMYRAVGNATALFLTLAGKKFILEPSIISTGCSPAPASGGMFKLAIADRHYGYLVSGSLNDGQSK